VSCPWRGTDCRPPSLRRRAGRPQLKRGPLGANTTMPSGDADLLVPGSSKRLVGHRRTWLRVAVIAAVLIVAIWFASGGYDRLTAPNARWKLPNGDTIEVLTFDHYYEASYGLLKPSVQGADYLRLQFRSTLTDTVRDRSDVVAAARVLCPKADSEGIRRVRIQPTRSSFFRLLTYARTHLFEVRPGGICEEVLGAG